MNPKNIYKEYKLDEYLWGDAFEIEFLDQDISTEEKRIALLDKVCALKRLEQLGKRWNKISAAQGKDLLLKSLWYDLAYSSAEITTQAQAEMIHKKIIRDFDNQCHCYTNWFGSVWSGESGASWNPLTENTFDMAIVLLNQSKLTFVLHISED